MTGERPRPLTWREAWPLNVWLRRWVTVVAAAVLACAESVLWPLPRPCLLVPECVLDTALLVTAIMSIRTNRVLANQRAVCEAAALARDAEASTLRRLAAPDAGPGRCPVCGLDDLTALTADDLLIERAPERCKVVEYGRRRAHRECAEFVPYQASDTAL